MKKNIVLIAALVLGAFSAIAQDVAPASSLSVTSKFGYESKYVFRGVQLADAIITPAIDVAYGDFYAGMWFAVPVENADSAKTSDNEMDIYAGYSTALTSILTIDAGACRYAYDDVVVDFMDKGNTLEGYVGVSANIFLSPSAYAYYDIDLQVFTLEGSIGHSFELSDKFSVDVGGSIGYVWADDSDNDYAYYGATADLSYAVNNSSSVGFGVRFSGSEDEQMYGAADDIDLSKSAFWYGLTFSTGF